jgi:hypothetical protein
MDSIRVQLVKTQIPFRFRPWQSAISSSSRNPDLHAPGGHPIHASRTGNPVVSGALFSIAAYRKATSAGQYNQTSDYYPADFGDPVRHSPHCVILAVDAPKLLVKVTESGVTDAASPCTVKGCEDELAAETARGRIFEPVSEQAIYGTVNCEFCNVLPGAAVKLKVACVICRPVQ